MSEFLEELHRPWRDDLAAIVARGVEEGVFTPPISSIEDFALRFAAVLDGLGLQGLRQMHELSRERLMELARQAARAELTARQRP